MTTSYIFAALIVAIMVVIVMYFSKVEDPDNPEPLPPQEPLRSNNPIPEDLQKMLEQREMARQNQYEQYMAQARAAEINRQNEHMQKMQRLSDIEQDLINGGTSKAKKPKTELNLNDLEESEEFQPPDKQDKHPKDKDQ